MVNEALVILPAATADAGLPEGATTVRWGDLASLVAALGRDGALPCVVVTDGLHSDTAAAVAGAIRARTGPVYEVRSAPWDGESPSAVSAACRGVISGFGVSGLRAAVALALGHVRPGS